MKIVITEKQFKTINKIINEGMSLSELPNDIRLALNVIEKNYGVKITDENIQKEFEQEGQTYPDNGKIDSTAFENIKNLLNELYKNFPNAPKNTNPNCNNLPGCVSGYRGYKTQAETFGGKVRERGGVLQRQKSVALPGFSQHATGKTFDILSVDSDWWENNKKIKDWVASNCGRFGFKVSYPKQGILRIAEPWHLYYIGGNKKIEDKKIEDKKIEDKKIEDKKIEDKKVEDKKVEDKKYDSLNKILNSFPDFVKKNKEVNTSSKPLDILRLKIIFAVVSGNKNLELSKTLDQETINSLKDFQVKNNLDQTGVFDLETQELFKEILSGEHQIDKKIEDKKIEDKKKYEISSNIKTIDLSKLNSSNLVLPSSIRGKTYGWRSAIPSLCPKSKRYCNWHWHAGKDYAYQRGTPIVAMQEGIIVEIGPVCFKIEHKDGTKTRYCHCDNVYFKKGETIKPGSIFATVGNKGISTGPHLHFEYYPANASPRTEKKGNISKSVTDKDPSGIEDKYWVLVKSNKLKDFEKDIKKI